MERICMTAQGLCAYLRGCCAAGRPTLVAGHAAPDTDAAVSSVMEAWRRQVTDGTPTVPVLRCDTLPAEVRGLFGDAAALLLTASAHAGAALLRDPAVPVVLTDHHTDPAFAGRVTAVVDHHLPAPQTTFTGIDADIRPVGAATTIVAHRWREQQLIPDGPVARILLGAILMDTDGLSPHKTTPDDAAAVAWLAHLYGGEPMALYAALQAQLLGETDIETLYRRDYRTYTDGGGKPFVGFAILKVWRHAMPDKAQVRRLLAADAAQSGCRLCVAKIALYDEAGPQEEYYLTAGDPAAAGRLLGQVCAVAGERAVRTAPDEAYLPAGCPRHGRKWYASRLEAIIASEKC